MVGRVALGQDIRDMKTLGVHLIGCKVRARARSDYVLERKLGSAIQALEVGMAKASVELAHKYKSDKEGEADG